jgi:hypothetical protein
VVLLPVLLQQLISLRQQFLQRPSASAAGQQQLQPRTGMAAAMLQHLPSAQG